MTSRILDESDHHAVEALKQFDLTEYEARSFIVLLESEDIQATEIAKLADVPKSRVYDVLNSLEQKGLVTKQPSSPKRYSANHAERALEHLIYRIDKSHEERLSFLRQKKDEITGMLPDRSDLEADPRRVRTVEGTYAVACKLIEGMQDCRETLLVAGDSPFVRLKSRTSFDNQIEDRSVSIRAVGIFDEDTKEEMQSHDAELREYEDVIQSFFVFDDERLLQVRASESQTVGLVTEGYALVQTYIDRFDRLWQEAADNSRRSRT